MVDFGNLSCNPEALVGSVLDRRFEIQALAGRGGMSLVYRARHIALDRVVAIKVLHSYLICDEQVLRRFRQEARTISSLSHANIVSVLSVGFLTEGLPYIVMDFLAGKSLAEVIKETGHLPVQRSLKIFRQTADALLYAHSQGVIHRDLKPGNIMLVSGNGDQDFVKIVDFGIAAIDPLSGLEVQKLTRTGALIGSPLYMSPEQCSSSTVDLRTDIYSFGCLCYETLSGQTPFNGNSPLDTMARHLTEIPEPFAAVNPAAHIPESLESVVFKALEKKPENRYQSFAELKEDLLLRDNSLSSPSNPAGALDKRQRTKRQGARLFKKAKRLIALLLLAGAMVAALIPSALKLKGEYDWQQLLTAADKALGTGDLEQARVDLELALDKLGTRKSHQLALALKDLASCYCLEKQYEVAMPLLNQALQAEAADSPSRISLWTDIGRVAMKINNYIRETRQPDRDFHYKGMINDRDIEQYFGNALQIGRKLGGTAYCLSGEALIWRGQLQLSRSDGRQAEEDFAEGLALLRRLPPPQQTPLIESLITVSRYKEGSKSDKASESLFQEASTNRHNIEADMSRKAALVWTMLAQSFRERKRLPEAEECFRKAIDIYKNTGIADRQRLSTNARLGNLYMQQKKFRQAQDCFADFIAIAEKNHRLSPELVQAYGTMATILIEQGRNLEALKQRQSALAVLSKAAHPDNAALAAACAALADNYSLVGDTEKAIAAYKRADMHYKALSPAADNRLARIINWHQLAKAYINARSPEAVSALAQSASDFHNYLQDEEKKPHPDGHIVEILEAYLAEVYCFQGKYGAARSELEKLCQYLTDTTGPESQSTLQRRYYLGNVYVALNELSSAREVYSQIIAAYKRHSQYDQAVLEATFSQLGRVDFMESRLKEAEENIDSALSIGRRLHGANYAASTGINLVLANMYQRDGRKAQAEDIYKCGIKLNEEHAGRDKANLIVWLCNYAQFLRAEKRDTEALALEQRVKELQANS